MMEKRLDDAEKAIQKLLESQATAFQFNKSVADSVEKIAASLDSLNRFQVETEVHRQHDVDFRQTVMKKIDLLIQRRETDLNEVFTEIRTEQAERNKLNAKVVVLEQKITDLSDDFSNSNNKDEKNSNILKVGLLTLLTSAGTAFLTWILAKH